MPAWVGAFAVAIIGAVCEPVAAIDMDGGLDSAVGKALFDRIWVPAPSSTRANDGLGPLFNARSCVQCHGAAGGGRITSDNDGNLAERGAVVRLSGPQGNGDAIYGAQIQTRAMQGHIAEAAIRIGWTASKMALDDGTEVELRRPDVDLSRLAYGPLMPGVKSALMLAPSLGVTAEIARVDLDALLSRQDSAGGHQVSSGRLSRDGSGRVLVFGRKATDASLEGSIATAFARDLGLSTSLHPQSAGDCTQAQTACRAALHGARDGDVEIGPKIVAAVAAYIRNFESPAGTPTNDGDGTQLFTTTGCAQCHSAELPGRNGGPVRLYSDLRLRDMGNELAGVTEASGQRSAEWRTAPLIGTGRRLAAGATLLHDGRARSVPEAILWHGGEAHAARTRYKALSQDERAALEKFVLSR